jgi:hypothetical protein
VNVKYSNHLEFKIRVRKIPANLPERIYRESTERYYNHYSFRHIAIMMVQYGRRRTLMMVAYDEFPDSVELITIHPITKKQIRDRIQIGRWTYERNSPEL